MPEAKTMGTTRLISVTDLGGWMEELTKTKVDQPDGKC
jgi:hypothetical protein